MYCRQCGKENPDDSKFCRDCGTKTIEDNDKTEVISKSNDKKIGSTDSDNEENKSQSIKSDNGEHEKVESPNLTQNFTVQKGIIVPADTMEKFQTRIPQYQHKYQGEQTVKVSTLVRIFSIVVVMAIIATGGVFGYKYWQKQNKIKAEDEAFRLELEDFKYQFTTQWNGILERTKVYKEKNDNVFNKKNTDMSNADKLHNFKLEAVSYESALKSAKDSLNQIKMSDRLTNYNNLGIFLSDLLMAINTNIQYCHNVIEVCGTPDDMTKREAKNKGQEVENQYILIYRNPVFKDFFSEDKKIVDLDTIGGQIEKIADARIEEKKVANNKVTPQAITINISGQSKTYNPPPQFENYTPSYVPPSTVNTSNYFATMKSLVQQYVNERKKTQKSIDTARNTSNKVKFKQECLDGANARYSLAMQAQNITPPPEYASVHQKFINCCIAGYTACVEAHNGVDSYGSNWYDIFSTVSQVNSSEMNTVCDTFGVY